MKQVKTASKPYLTLQPNNKQYQSVYKSLMAAQPTPKQDGFCEGVYTSDGVKPQSIELYKLSNKKYWQRLCAGVEHIRRYGAWVLDESLTGKAIFVTEHASDFWGWDNR